MKKRIILFVLLISFGTSFAQTPPLQPEFSIALPDTAGRIDHMALDLSRKRLFVSELGNGTLDVIDLASRKVIHRISDLKEPQGVAYVPGADILAVASGGDGTLRLYAGSDYAPRGLVALGDDADNVRLDSRNGHVVVGYGRGALAVIDPKKAEKLSEIPLPAHPESFQLSGARLFINVPDAGQIVTADINSGGVLARWKPPFGANFPMTLDDAGHVAVVFRSPAKLVLFDAANGQIAETADTCRDSDDLFFDASRHRFYVSCGAGAVDSFEASGEGLRVLPRVNTVSGARTSLFVPELDRLFVAERAGLLGDRAAIAVFRPASRSN